MSRRPTRLDEPLAPLDVDDIVERGVRRLAGAVLLLAVRDLERRDGDEHRASALRFFRDDDSNLRFWCRAIDLDADDLRANTERLCRSIQCHQP